VFSLVVVGLVRNRKLGLVPKLCAIICWPMGWIGGCVWASRGSTVQFRSGTVGACRGTTGITHHMLCLTGSPQLILPDFEVLVIIVNPFLIC
jgi:hypothetical protein